MSKKLNENLMSGIKARLNVKSDGGDDEDEDEPANLSTPDVSRNGSRDAFDYALNLISRQMHSVGQLRAKLISKRYGKAEADGALARLVELKFLDDDAFAETYFENLKKYKSYGFYGIQKKLYERQLAKPLVAKLMRSFTADDELAVAQRFLARQFGERGQDRERLQRMLANRGFRTEVIFKAVKNVKPLAAKLD
jgi:regulatory protein